MSYRDDANIWRYRAGVNEQLNASVSADMSAVYSPDARKIAFVSNRTGNFELWMTGADGKDPVQLTTFRRFPVGSPSWSPDNRKLAFDVRMAGHSEIYVMDAEPGSPAQRLLVNGLTTIAVPTWSRDGRFIYFGSRPAGIWNVYRVATNGGNPVQITRDGGFRAIESPDGKYLYFKKNETGLWRLPLGPGSREQPVSDAIQGQNWAQWCLGPAGLYFLPAHLPQNYGPVPIELLRPGSNTPETIGHTDKAPTSGDRLAVSGDGASFLYSQLDQRGSSILLLEQ